MRFFSISFVLCFPAFSLAQPAVVDKATVDYLLSLQQSDGGFLAAALNPKQDRKPVSSLRATSAAVRSLRYRGAELPNKEKSEKFVIDCFDEKSGGFADAPRGKPDLLLTAVGLMAVVELGIPRERYVPKATNYLTENAVNFEDARIAIAGFEAVGALPPDDIREKWANTAQSMKNADGTFGKDDGMVRETGSAAAMMLRLKLEIDASAILPLLKNGQRDDGGFGKAGVKGSDLETSYRVVRALHMLKENPKGGEKLQRFIAKCRNADGGYGVEPGKPSSVGGTYYATVIQHWLK